MVDWCQQEKSPDFMENLPAESSGSKQEKRGKGMMNFALRSIFVRTCKWLFTCRNILRHGASGFTSPPKEVMFQIFIALKNLTLWHGMNPRTLTLMASALNLSPSGRHTWRDQSKEICTYLYEYVFHFPKSVLVLPETVDFLAHKIFKDPENCFSHSDTD
jgi:hypothetical protein